eukprot:TRINITY_DN5234_c2_g1_i1.p1 TRINITY_DN5234_c2_g1~~TRINITY_DN5234_c2_g1_i1.p1  ORF type:complete len:570 (+),score=82.83 TRINITY_DN5234_c2_g1_i1:1620-3329(+)
MQSACFENTARPLSSRVESPSKEVSPVHGLFTKLNRYLKQDNLAHIHGVLKDIYKLAEDKQSLPNGKTPLHLATRNSNMDIWKLLISMGLHQNNKIDKEGNAPLHYAAQFCNIVAVKALISSGANLNIGNSDNTPPLHVAAFVGSLDVLNILLEAGANINFTDTKNQVALHYAISGGHMEVIKHLVGRKPKLEIRTRNGVTPLEAALQLGNFSAVQLLSSNGADMSKLYDPDWNSGILEYHHKMNPILGSPDEIGFLHVESKNIKPLMTGSTSPSKKIAGFIKKCNEKKELHLTRSKMKSIRSSLAQGQLPHSSRASFWKCFCVSSLSQNMVKYEELLRQKPSVVDSLQIDKDINRTLRDHIVFAKRYGEGQCKLYRILSTYALYNTKTRYTQGMSTLAAVVLLVLPEEKEAFSVLATLFNEYHLTSWYENNLQGLTESFSPFEELVMKKIPRVHEHLDKVLREGMMVDYYSSLFLTNWILELFFGIIPFDLMLKVWDLIFLVGHHFVFSVGLAILQKFEEPLLAAPTSVSILQVLKNTAEATYNHEEFLRAAIGMKVSVDDLHEQHLM